MQKKYIPPFLYDIVLRLKIIWHRNDCKNSIEETTSDKDAIIIGNGPSLNDTIKGNLEKLQKNDCFMVNQSAVSEYFEQIKPCYYAIMDPFYFVQAEKNKNIPMLLNAFSTKLKWPMTIFVPYNQRESYIINEFKKNPFLSLIYLNSVSFFEIEQFSGERWFKYWNQNIMHPLSQTVLNTVMSVAITMKYKNIYLIGADTSWTEMLRVDQSNNDLYTEEKHFYNIEKRILAKYNDERSNMADELGSIMRVFIYYNILKKYAKYNGCHLYNASAYSLIDCLERKAL